LKKGEIAEERKRKTTERRKLIMSTKLDFMHFQSAANTFNISSHHSLAIPCACTKLESEHKKKRNYVSCEKNVKSFLVVFLFLLLSLRIFGVERCQWRVSGEPWQKTWVPPLCERVENKYRDKKLESQPLLWKPNDEREEQRQASTLKTRCSDVVHIKYTERDSHAHIHMVERLFLLLLAFPLFARSYSGFEIKARTTFFAAPATPRERELRQ
jgi:hypothetical protein